jgi:Uma2 family endonuclease
MACIARRRRVKNKVALHVYTVSIPWVPMATKTLITASEFSQSGPQTDCFELVRGELIPMPPPGGKHGVVCVNTGFLLKGYTKQIGHGVVMGNDAGIITEKDPDSVRGVDVALFLHPAWNGDAALEGYTDQIADLLVEVRSPSQSWSAVVAKVGEYLQMGVKLVWVVDPKVKRLTVFSPDREPETFAAENEWDGGAILSGLHFKVADLFEGV